MARRFMVMEIMTTTGFKLMYTEVEVKCHAS